MNIEKQNGRECPVAEALKMLQGELVSVQVTEVVRAGIVLDLYLAELAKSVRGFVPRSWMSDAQEPIEGATMFVVVKQIEQRHGRAEFVASDLDARQLLSCRSLQPGMDVSGTVKRVLREGLIINIERELLSECNLKGSTALVPQPEMGSNAYQVGDTVDATILSVNPERLSIRASIRRFQSAQFWKTACLGDKAVGTIVNEAKNANGHFGWFVRLKGGVDALLHSSQTDDQQEVGKEVTVTIIELCEERRRVGVSTLRQNVNSFGHSITGSRERTKQMSPASSFGSVSPSRRFHIGNNVNRRGGGQTKRWVDEKDWRKYANSSIGEGAISTLADFFPPELRKLGK